jgi:hypothetical protein
MTNAANEERLRQDEFEKLWVVREKEREREREREKGGQTEANSSLPR